MKANIQNKHVLFRGPKFEASINRQKWDLRACAIGRNNEINYQGNDKKFHEKRRNLLGPKYCDEKQYGIAVASFRFVVL